ncbi:MAG: glucoamylase family protein, partial [Oscillospiraceae bacterium]
MADTNAGALCEAGRRDAQALTVTGRRRAHTGSIRHAARTLVHAAKAVTPETPDGAWLRDNHTLARTAASDAAAALRHAHTLRASGKQTVLHACCAGLLRACGNALTPQAAQAYLAGFQDVLPLETAELALLVPGLQAAAVCALADTYAHDGAAAPALFTSLRALGTAAWAALTERCDRVGRILARDPAGVYPAMDAATRTRYRQTVARLARRTGRTEIDIAEDVLARAQSGEGARRHVGWFLLREVLGAPEKRRDGAWYIAAVIVGTLALSLLLGFATGSVSGAVLLLIPVSEVVKGLLDAVLLRVTKPRFVPRLALRRGIPPEGKTLCVIAALLTCPGDAHTLAARLEEYALCNRDAGEQLLFGLLADLPEADMERTPIDPAILRAACEEIEALNARYGGRFYLFTRERVQTPDGKWSAWERKRGALLRLAQLLCGETDAMHCAAGDAAALRGTAYLLTLDADTRLTPGAARALAGAMLHPLNRPVVDARRGVVTHGYGLLHPRMATELQSARASDWARVFAGPGGSDPYGGVCGELYMDCFDRGGFSGKGILDVRALLACCGGDALPEQRILSHDALEGAYLHGGFLGDVELTDTFPAAPLAWGARAHRWIRGDWQNAPWIFSRRARALHPIDRFRLADSLRRSLIAPVTWAAVFLGCVLRWPGLRLAAYAALLALAQGLIYALGHPIVHPADARVRYHSSVLPGLAAAVVQTVLRLILLPWEAVLNASAIVTALWRMTVSHRDLLQWQTAAQRAAKRDGLGAYLRALWPASALGLLTAVLTPSPTGLAAGIVWTLSPFVLAALGAPNAPGAAPLQHAAQRELLGWAKATWRYFETFCTAGEHYLPPDNVQTQPPTGTAHRTSPTNMGFALLSALCAHALGIDNGRGLALAEQMLTTMEQLPRWNGHFYNWYHTCTLRPMPPLYVSTVDSGNCAAALLAAANALRGWGQGALAARAQALCDGMDFALLYDPQRRLMHIGIDTGSGKRSEGYYDLLESEARLTSYFAVARGDVPREHWRALSRAQVQHERYRGCVSWSGSVFEYLMPELFLPPQRDSLLWESAKFCLRVQRRRVRTGQPWGVSESAYFALDSALSYRYKAHGCAALAMQPDMDRELVLSPYSAFLALAVEPRAAMRNLRKLAALGLLGQHGFFDALDCTRARTGGGGQIVHCVMAHHQGMSLLSACNALCGGQVQRWFLADPAMRAHMSLLSERLPLGAPALRRRPETQRGKPRRRSLPDLTVEGTGVDAEAPRCTLLSGTYCLAVTEAGQSFARWHALSVCRRGTRSDPAAAPMLSLETGGACTPLLPGTADAARWRFTVRAAQFSTRHGSVTAVQTFTVPERVNGEVRALTLSSPDGIDGTVRLTFEAVLAPWEDYVNHPAFARLGFQSVLRRNALLLRRLGRGEKPETWLCAVCDRQADFYAEGAIPGWLRAGYVQVRVAVHTPPDTPWRVRFALGVGAHEDDAFAAAQRALVLPPESAAALPGALAAQYGMTDAELEGAMAHVSPLLFPTAAPDAATEQLKRPALWAHGISGDLPVWCARPEAHVLRQWALLRALGIGCDLALCTSDGGDYLQPTRTKVHGALAALDLTHCLDAPGGVHLVPEDAFADVAAAAAIRPGMAHTRCTLPLLPPPGDRRTMPTGSDVHWDADGTVSFTGLPPRAWSNVLTNGRFGFLATDAGTGHLWYRNAHTGRINRWLCDPWVLRGTETLRMTTRTGAVSLFDDDGHARVEYGFGWAAWERTVDGMSVRVTAFVPEDANARMTTRTGAVSLFDDDGHA